MHSLARAPSSLTVPQHFAAISISEAAFFITVALLLNWKRLSKVEFLKPWLYLCAGIGFAAAFLTAWANAIDGWLRGVPYIGVAAPVVIAVVLAYIVAYDLWPRHGSTKTTEASALLLPAFSPAIGGFVGQVLATAFSYLAIASASILATAFGV